MRVNPCIKGFTLVELMLAAALGLILFGVALSLLIGDAVRSEAMAELIQTRRLQRRTLKLIKADLVQGATWLVEPADAASGSCGLAGRRPVLAIQHPNASPAVLYTIGKAPSPIWRSPVLMRCGPAFDLEGRTRPGSSFQNRVVLDAVEAFRITQPDGLPVLKLELEQRLPGDGPVVRSAAFG